MIKGYQVFEFAPTGGCNSVSKVFPTSLGAKRVRNRIVREHSCLCSVGYRYIIIPVLK